MTDLKALKERIDLRVVVEDDLGRPRSRGSRAWTWRCPLHDERHGASLAVWQNGWQCFGACQTGGDVITWLMRYRRLTFQEAVRDLGGDARVSASANPAPRPLPAARQVAGPPPDAWQQAGQQILETAEATLWSPAGARALAYLRDQRGLLDSTIHQARLGFIPGHYRGWRTLYGLTVPCGILIPWLASGMLWGLKVRRAAGDIRYVQVAGGQVAGGLYGADTIRTGQPLLLTEGELNCLTAWQAAPPEMAAVSLGSASQAVDARWRGVLMTIPVILALFDDDCAGIAGLERVAGLTRRVRQLHLPAGFKDLNDFYVTSRNARQPNLVARWLAEAVAASTPG